MPDLRNKLIRLAHQNPDLRPHLLPLLSKEARSGRAIPAQMEKAWKGLADARSALDQLQGYFDYRLHNRDGQTDMGGNPILNPEQRRQAERLYKELRSLNESLQGSLTELQRLDGPIAGANDFMQYT